MRAIGLANTDSDRNGNAGSDSYSHANFDAQNDAHAAGFANTTASPNASPAP